MTPSAPAVKSQGWRGWNCVSRTPIPPTTPCPRSTCGGEKVGIGVGWVDKGVYEVHCRYATGCIRGFVIGVLKGVSEDIRGLVMGILEDVSESVLSLYPSLRRVVTDSTS